MWPIMQLPGTSTATLEKRRKYTVSFFTKTQTGGLLSELKWKGTRLDPERFSNWFTFLRVLAYVVRFIQNSCSSEMLKEKGSLTVDEVNDAEVVVLRQAQQESFLEELCCIKKQHALPTSSKILPISPTLSDDGLL